MTDLDIIESKEDDIHEVIEQYMEFIAEDMKKISFPTTISAMLLLLTNSEFIKGGIHTSIKEDNIYPAKILFRSLIEHFLRFQYMFFRVSREQKDDIGNEYFTYSFYSEIYDIARAWRKINEFLTSNPGKDPYDAIKMIVPNLKDIPKKELIEKSAQFRFKEIIKYIDDEINKEKNYEKNRLILDIIPEYAELSSFVHGGPMTAWILKEMAGYESEKRTNEGYSLSLKAHRIAGLIKLQFFLLMYGITKKKEYLDANLKIREIMMRKKSDEEE